MPKAVLRDTSKCGGPEIFTVEDVPAVNPFLFGQWCQFSFLTDPSVKKLGPYDVAIKVSYTSVNPAEVKLAAERSPCLDQKDDKGKPALCIPGADFSGVVEAIGAKVTKFAVGDEVFGETSPNSVYYGSGTWAEEMVTQEDYVVKKPKGLPFDIAGSLGTVAVTAMTAIKYYMGGWGQDCGGQKILVIGGSTATGMMLIQIAKAYGAAFVAATCSSKNADLVKSLGADLVLDYASQDWATELLGKDLDVIYDCVGGGASWCNSSKVLKPSWGKYIAVTGIEPEAPYGATLNRKFWSFFGNPAFYSLKRCPNTEYLAEVARLQGEGKLKLIIDSEFPFTTEGVRAALEKVAGRHTSGKVVIKIAA